MPDPTPPASPPLTPAEELKREKWRFLHVSAHQLRSPLATIQTQLKTILDGYLQDPGKVRQMIERSERKTRDLLTTLNEMLELARLSEREGGAPAEPVDLERLVAQMRESMEMKAQARQVHFDLAIRTTLPTVWGTPSYLSHLLFNLVENAIKYTPAGGKVGVGLEYHADRHRFEGRVTDTGIGIPKEFQARLFEEFARAPNAQAEEREGTGLGLAIVRRVVDFYGGTLAFESEPGQGTTFHFELPLNPVTVEDRQQFHRHQKKQPLRIVIIGGKAAGPKAAAKARRMDPGAEITVIERERLLSYAGCGLPYYISGQVQDLGQLMTTLEGERRDPDFFRRVKGIDVFNRTECVAIDRARKEVEIRQLKTGATRRLPYDRLIIAAGSRPQLPPLPGVGLTNVFTLWRMEDAVGLRAALTRRKPQEAVIVGGGLIGIESAEAVVACGARVTIVEAQDQMLPILDRELALLVERHFAEHGVRIHTGEPVREIEGRDGRVAAVVTARRRIPADIVIMAVGVAPEVELARRAGLALGPTGAVAVDEYLRTSDPDILAIGDCVENTDLITGKKVYLPLGSTANKHGRVAGINAIAPRETFPGVVGTIVLKGFEYNIGVTGLTEAAATAAGFDPVSVLVAGPDREHYYASARMMALKITGDARTGRLLGVQAVGEGKISKRIDVAAAVLIAGGTVDAVSKLDLGYAPPYSTAMDILITAANVFKNKQSERFNGIGALELHEKLREPAGLLLVDVRNPEEHGREAIPGAVSIPLRALRGRLHELPREQELVLYCAVGIDAYEAARVLAAHGFTRVRVLEGGIYAWPFEKV